MLIPAGFWSYSTSDDESSRGRLSQLRALLAGELQQQLGRAKVNIFQDVEAIPPGRDWARQIDEAIEASSFLIPIVTPAFLQSEWCCKEVEMFRRREERLGAGGLIFPIHYIDTDYLDATDPHECHDRSVLDFPRTRQWVDFRRLRIHDPDREDVALILEGLASGIRNELRRPTARPAPSPPAASAAIREKTAAEKPQASAAQIADFRRRADSGDVEGQFILGCIYYFGRGVDKDEREAVAWFHKAAEQGHALAQSHLGAMYADGLVVAKDEHEAVAWSRKAAEQNNAIAQSNLGYMYQFGRGVAKDEREAVAWYRKAADQGYAPAQTHLGFLYANGEGVAKDEREAVAWYRRAAEQGDAYSQYNLGDMYENGKGLAKDEREAIAWYRKAAEQGQTNAKERLAKLGAI